MRTLNKLTALQVKSLTRPGRFADGGGLYLQVSPTGTRSWLFRFTRDGKAREMGLGPVGTVSLAEAREKALECRRALHEGLDPIEQRNRLRRAASAEAARSMTFRQAAKAYIEAHQAGWRNAKHASQWTATLEHYAFPIFGDLDVGEVAVGDVLKALEVIWRQKPETAGRVRGRVEAVLDWATARGHRRGENPARWRGHLDKLLPARSKVARVRHHPALPYAEIPGFMLDLANHAGVSRRALEFTILTAARTGEVIGAKVGEIDFGAKVWTIPGARMKAGREHRVPLCARAIAIIEGIQRDGDHLFPGAKEGRPLSNMAMTKVLASLGRTDSTVHGFRSSFRDWAAEQTGFANEVCEAALAHVVGDKVEAAYRRGDLFEKRRRLMEAWAAYCCSPSRNKSGNVVPINAAEAS
ncbi:integrase arm-type DNA-binding domain-containing protein [Parvibaculum sp.]|uniref:tyrosine-type recombinase/integrase n=1 Tax=Parvibaculum sp. TaxID=2024848 RepID=UPI00320FA3D4